MKKKTKFAAFIIGVSAIIATASFNFLVTNNKHNSNVTNNNLLAKTINQKQNNRTLTLNGKLQDNFKVSYASSSLANNFNLSLGNEQSWKISFNNLNPVFSNYSQKYISDISEFNSLATKPDSDANKISIQYFNQDGTINQNKTNNFKNSINNYQQNPYGNEYGFGLSNQDPLVLDSLSNQTPLIKISYQYAWNDSAFEKDKPNNIPFDIFQVSDHSWAFNGYIGLDNDYNLAYFNSTDSLTIKPISVPESLKQMTANEFVDNFDSYKQSIGLEISNYLPIDQISDLSLVAIPEQGKVELHYTLKNTIEKDQDNWWSDINNSTTSKSITLIDGLWINTQAKDENAITIDANSFSQGFIPALVTEQTFKQWVFNNRLDIWNYLPNNISISNIELTNRNDQIANAISYDVILKNVYLNGVQDINNSVGPIKVTFTNFKEPVATELKQKTDYESNAVININNEQKNWTNITAYELYEFINNNQTNSDVINELANQLVQYVGTIPSIESTKVKINKISATEYNAENGQIVITFTLSHAYEKNDNNHWIVKENKEFQLFYQNLKTTNPTQVITNVELELTGFEDYIVSSLDQKNDDSNKNQFEINLDNAIKQKIVEYYKNNPNKYGNDVPDDFSINNVTNIEYDFSKESKDDTNGSIKLKSYTLNKYYDDNQQLANSEKKFIIPNDTTLKITGFATFNNFVLNKDITVNEEGQKVSVPKKDDQDAIEKFITYENFSKWININSIIEGLEGEKIYKIFNYEKAGKFVENTNEFKFSFKNMFDITMFNNYQSFDEYFKRVFYYSTSKNPDITPNKLNIQQQAGWISYIYMMPNIWFDNNQWYIRGENSFHSHWINIQNKQYFKLRGFWPTGKPIEIKIDSRDFEDFIQNGYYSQTIPQIVANDINVNQFEADIKQKIIDLYNEDKNKILYLDYGYDFNKNLKVIVDKNSWNNNNGSIDISIRLYNLNQYNDESNGLIQDEEGNFYKEKKLTINGFKTITQPSIETIDPIDISQKNIQANQFTEETFKEIFNEKLNDWNFVNINVLDHDSLSCKTTYKNYHSENITYNNLPAIKVSFTADYVFSQEQDQKIVLSQDKLYEIIFYGFNDVNNATLNQSYLFENQSLISENYAQFFLMDETPATGSNPTTIEAISNLINTNDTIKNELVVNSNLLVPGAKIILEEILDDNNQPTNKFNNQEGSLILNAYLDKIYDQYGSIVDNTNKQGIIEITFTGFKKVNQISLNDSINDISLNQNANIFNDKFYLDQISNLSDNEIKQNIADYINNNKDHFLIDQTLTISKDNIKYNINNDNNTIEVSISLSQGVNNDYWLINDKYPEPFNQVIESSFSIIAKQRGTTKIKDVQDFKIDAYVSDFYDLSLNDRDELNNSSDLFDRIKTKATDVKSLFVDDELNSVDANLSWDNFEQKLYVWNKDLNNAAKAELYIALKQTSGFYFENSKIIDARTNNKTFYTKINFTKYNPITYIEPSINLDSDLLTSVDLSNKYAYELINDTTLKNKIIEQVKQKTNEIFTNKNDIEESNQISPYNKDPLQNLSSTNISNNIIANNKNGELHYFIDYTIEEQTYYDNRGFLNTESETKQLEVIVKLKDCLTTSVPTSIEAPPKGIIINGYEDQTVDQVLESQKISLNEFVYQKMWDLFKYEVNNQVFTVFKGLNLNLAQDAVNDIDAFKSWINIDTSNAKITDDGKITNIKISFNQNYFENDNYLTWNSSNQSRIYTLSFTGFKAKSSNFLWVIIVAAVSGAIGIICISIIVIMIIKRKKKIVQAQ